VSLYAEVKKTLGSFTLDIKLEAGEETLALLGASGCGKSLTLKCIAGLITPDEGRIVVNDRVLFDSDQNINLTPQQRSAGMLFQTYALFPHMTVLQNIRTGTVRDTAKRQREQKVEAAMVRFGLSGLAERFPHQLSGGQQQRAALARLLVSEPEILLLDEPFAALDSHLRYQMEQEVQKILREFGKTAVLVSHDRDEVFRMSDKVAVMGTGTIETFGTGAQVFRNPQTRTAAMLTGCRNISSVVHRKGETVAEDWGVVLEAGQIPKDVHAVGIRMHDVRPAPGKNTCRCRVVNETENAFSYIVLLQPLGGTGVISWELEKTQWNMLRAPEVEISLPPEALLMLRK